MRLRNVEYYEADYLEATALRDALEAFTVYNPEDQRVRRRMLEIVKHRCDHASRHVFRVVQT